MEKIWKGWKGHRLVSDVFNEDESAPAALFFHGGGQTRHAWKKTAQTVSTCGWVSISFDLRGHGDSDWSQDGAYPYDSFAADVSAVRTQLTRPHVLVGASLGGISSLLAQGEDPHPACLGLILVDIAPHIERKGAERIVNFMQAHPDGFASLEEAAAAVAAYLPHRKKPTSTDGLKKNLRWRDGRYHWHYDRRFVEGISLEDVTKPERMIEAARALAVPALLIRGKLSDVLSEEGAQAFLEAAPEAEYVDITGAGHMVAGDENDRFTEAILSFLEKRKP